MRLDKDTDFSIPRSGHRFPGVNSKLTLQSIFSLPKGHDLLAGDGGESFNHTPATPSSPCHVSGLPLLRDWGLCLMRICRGTNQEGGLVLKPLHWLLSLLQTISYGNCPLSSGDSSYRALRGKETGFSHWVTRLPWALLPGGVRRLAKENLQKGPMWV